MNETSFYNRQQERRAQRMAGQALEALTRNQYFDEIPLGQILDTLADLGFSIEEVGGILAGESGRLHDQIGPISYLTVTWFKMDSGRYEVVAYVN